MLVGPRTKLARATKHIDELSEHLLEFLASEPYALDLSEDPHGDLIYRVRIRAEIPLEWSAMVGDAVHNLRATLDHLACALVQHGGGSLSRSTQFPFNKTHVGLGKVVRQALNGAKPESRRFVKRLKPYGGGSLVLNQINALDVADKHQSVLVVGAAHRSVLMTINMPRIPGAPTDFEVPSVQLGIRPADRQFPLKDGDTVFRIANAARGDDHIESPGISIEPAFGDVYEVAGLSLEPTLRGMHAHVKKIVDIAERRLLT